MFLLTFNNLITPVLIRFVFYVMVSAIATARKTSSAPWDWW